MLKKSIFDYFEAHKVTKIINSFIIATMILNKAVELTRTQSITPTSQPGTDTTRFLYFITCSKYYRQ